MLLALALLLLLTCAPVESSAGSPSPASWHNGGAYGQWRRDEQGLPSYVYTRDQTRRADTNCSVPPSSSADARHSTEHSFQLGNDRLVLVGNNYGAFRLRADEGGPKWLTGGWTGIGGHQYGGGFGHLFDAGEQAGPSALLSSYYSGGARERQFGVGYARSTARAQDMTVTHTAAVPAGQDTCVLLQVDIARANSSTQKIKRLTWAEVWGSLMVHLDPAWSHAQNRSSFSETHYRSSWVVASNRSDGKHGDESLLLHRRKWLGLTVAERDYLSAGYDNPMPQNGSMWDEAPPSPFLAAVPCMNDARNTTTALANDAAAYFGSGTAAQPTGAHLKINKHGLPESDASLIAATTFELAPGETMRLCYVYGYVQADSGVAEAQKLVDNARPVLMAQEGIAANISRAWGAVLPSVSVPTRPWLGDETIWHSYYLRGAITYDTFYEESIVDQGTAYRYSFGFQGAARDPVQHILPLIETAPHIARSVLRYTFKEMMPNFHSMDRNKISSLPYAMEGRGLIDNGGGGWKADPQAQKYFPDDLDLYLLLAASEYLLATKDTAFLLETVSFWNSNETHTVLQALHRSVEFVVEQIGVGPHGIMRMLSSDWDDGFGAKNLVPGSAYNVSESVLSASLATVVLPRVAAVLDLVDDPQSKFRAQQARQFADSNRRAIMHHAYNGKWLRRAWVDEEIGWIGDLTNTTPGIPILGYEGVFSAQHGWAFAGGVFTEDVSALNTSLASLLEHCRKPYNYGFAYICGPLEDPHPPPLNTEVESGRDIHDATTKKSRSKYAVLSSDKGKALDSNRTTSRRRRLQFSDAPGMWAAVNYPTVLGLLAVNRTDLGWEEYVRNSLHWQAGVTPDIWIGLWTGSDSVNADGMPSDWTNDFPALCMHRHAWPVYTLRRLLGLQYSASGIEIRPTLPPRLGAFQWSTQLSSLRWDGNRTWAGHYAPTVGSTGRTLLLQVDMRHVVPARTLVSVSVAVTSSRAPRTEVTTDFDHRVVASGASTVEVPVELRSTGTWVQFVILAS